jgi:hypothetical protein
MIGPLAGQLGPMGVATSKASYAYGVVMPLAPIAYYPLTGDANDISGNGFNGTPANVTWGAEAGAGASMGLAPSFNGTSSIVDIYSAGLSSAFNVNEFTIIMWSKIASGVWSDGALRFLISMRQTSHYIAQLSKADLASKMYGAWTDDSGTTGVTADTGWTFYALRRSVIANKHQLYKAVGGSVSTLLDKASNGSSALSVTSANIGKISTGVLYYFSGNLAHIAIFNTALADDSIAKLAQAI